MFKNNCIDEFLFLSFINGPRSDKRDFMVNKSNVRFLREEDKPYYCEQ